MAEGNGQVALICVIGTPPGHTGFLSAILFEGVHDRFYTVAPSLSAPRRLRSAVVVRPSRRFAIVL